MAAPHLRWDSGVEPWVQRGFWKGAAWSPRCGDKACTHEEELGDLGPLAGAWVGCLQMPAVQKVSKIASKHISSLRRGINAQVAANTSLMLATRPLEVDGHR